MQIRSGNMPQVFLMYGMIGFGMASPYLVIGAFPELLRFLPKPGEWMETFKKAMGFCLLIAVVWILYFVRLEKLLPTVTLLFALWFACWMVGRNQLPKQPTARKKILTDYLIALVVLAVVILFSFQTPVVKNPYTIESAMLSRLYGGQGEHWRPYTPATLETALASGKRVAVDFTADWCINCKVLEANVLESKPILKVLDEEKIVSLTADCTRKGDATAFLKKLGSEQVPVLAIFDPNNPEQPIVLRGFYTQKTLIELLKQ
jgi:thiol:disulfide interchange protein